MFFDSILDEFANIDEFRRETCPAIFIVYAHDNPQKGEAKAEIVLRIVGWLERSHCEVLSDKAPLGQFAGPQDDVTVRNILDSQFRLLPRFAGGSELSGDTPVDKVVVCGSEVLENYARDDFAAPFIAAVKEAYERPGRARDDIRKLIETKTHMEGFHHVLTELAFLEIRRSCNRTGHGIVPLALCGELPGTYLPKFVENCDVVLKIEQSTDLSEQHRFFFKLLAQIYTDSHVAIRKFKSCYEDAVKNLDEQGSVSTDEARRIIRSQLAIASRALRDHVTAAIRVLGTARNGLENARKARRLKVMRTLSPLPYQDRKDRNQAREEGTCVWATTHPRFKAWQHRSTASLLWVSADPGCGKSVLAKSLIDEVLLTSDTSTTCYFFFKDDFDDQRSIGNAFRCILHQLFSQKPFLLTDELLEKFEGDGQLLSSARGLWKVLVQATCQADAGQVICILDALDECKEDGRKLLGEHLTDFYLKQESTSSLKFLITSRPYLDIERDFRLLEDKMPTIRLAGETDAESQQIEKEIDIVIRARALQLKTIVRLSDDEYDVLLKGLTRVRNRTYLWATLTFDVVRTAIKKTCADLEAVLRELPPSVDDAYERILSRNQGSASNKARAILKIIVAATRPLSLLEMSQALALEESPAPQETLQHQNEDEFCHTVRHLCGLFVAISDSKIYLLHQTAREFLLRTHQSTSDPLLSQQSHQWRQSLILTECHHLLAKLCLNCLLLQKSRFDALYRYAAWKWIWAFHFRAAGNSTPTEHMLHQARTLCDAKYLLGFESRGHSRKSFIDTHYFVLVEKLGSSFGHMTSLMIASALGLNAVVRLQLSERKAKLQAVDKLHKRSALLWACAEGHTDVVQTLLDEMSSIASWRALRKSDFDGHTPLKLAIWRNHQATVRLLLDRGAQVKTAHLERRPPLHLAAHGGRESIAQLLLGKGALVNAANTWGETPLFQSAFRGHKAVTQLLLDRGAKVNVRDKGHRTPLHGAIWWGNESVAQLLLDRGAEVDATDKEGMTPLFDAVTVCGKALVQLLLDRGAQINVTDKAGRTPLFRAATNHSAAVVQLLLDRGAQVNVTDKRGQTPLHGAFHYEVARLLLDRGAQVNAADKNGQTPLFRQVADKNSEVARLLLQRGAHANCWDSAGRTPLDKAETSLMTEILLEAGAQKAL